MGMQRYRDVKSKEREPWHKGIFHYPIKLPSAYNIPEDFPNSKTKVMNSPYRAKMYGLFYSRLAEDAGWAGEPSTETNGNLVIKWKGRKVTSVHVLSAPGSLMASSPSFWKKFKALAMEVLPLDGESFVLFDRHTEGILSLCALKASFLAENHLGEKLRASEEIHEMVYDYLFVEGRHHHFPVIHDIFTEDGSFSSFGITHSHVPDGNREKFEEYFLPKYCDGSTGEQQWAISWRYYEFELYVHKIIEFMDDELSPREIQWLWDKTDVSLRDAKIPLAGHKYYVHYEPSIITKSKPRKEFDINGFTVNSNTHWELTKKQKKNLRNSMLKWLPNADKNRFWRFEFSEHILDHSIVKVELGFRHPAYCGMP